MTAWGLIALGVVILLVQLLTLATVVTTDARDRAGQQRPDDAPPRIACVGCDATFADERRGIDHAKAEHGAPDDEHARVILTERPSE